MTDPRSIATRDKVTGALKFLGWKFSSLFGEHKAIVVLIREYNHKAQFITVEDWRIIPSVLKNLINLRRNDNIIFTISPKETIFVI